MTGSPTPWCMAVLADIAAGLAALHQRQIVHRDLKPHNVLLTEAGRAKLSDMGLSKQLVSEQSSFESHGSGERLAGCGRTPITAVVAPTAEQHQHSKCKCAGGMMHSHHARHAARSHRHVFHCVADNLLLLLLLPMQAAAAAGRLLSSCWPRTVVLCGRAGLLTCSAWAASCTTASQPVDTPLGSTTSGTQISCAGCAHSPGCRGHHRRTTW